MLVVMAECDCCDVRFFRIEDLKFEVELQFGF